MKDNATQPASTAPEQLSPHFSLREMTLSATAIRRHLDNTPTAEAILRLTHLCHCVLEPLRRRVGRVLITSGYRSLRVNQAVGGAPTSQHCLGEAADIYVSSSEQAEKYARIIQAETDFDQLILEPRGEHRKRWLHVSYTRRRANRHQVLR